MEKQLHNFSRLPVQTFGNRNEEQTTKETRVGLMLSQVEVLPDQNFIFVEVRRTARDCGDHICCEGSICWGITAIGNRTIKANCSGRLIDVNGTAVCDYKSGRRSTVFRI